MGERRGAYRVLVRKHERKGPTGRPKHNNTKKDLLEGGWGGAWNGLFWLRIGTGGGNL